MMIDDLNQKVQVEITLEKMEEQKKENQEDEKDFELIGDKIIKAVADNEESEASSQLKAKIKEEEGYIALDESSQEQSSQRSRVERINSQEQLLVEFGKKYGLTKDN